MEASQVKQGVDPFGEFPSEVAEDIRGLTYLGFLEETFEFGGHSFTLRTLKGEPELIAGILCKAYTETLTQAKAWAWANVSLALHAVDGDSEFCPQIGPDSIENARGRFRYCTSQWYWPLAEHLFARYLELVQRQVDATEAIRDLSTRSLESFSPSLDSSNDQGDSESQQAEDITELLD